MTVNDMEQFARIADITGDATAYGVAAYGIRHAMPIDEALIILLDYALDHEDEIPSDYHDNPNTGKGEF